MRDQSAPSRCVEVPAQAAAVQPVAQAADGLIWVEGRLAHAVRLRQGVSEEGLPKTKVLAGASLKQTPTWLTCRNPRVALRYDRA